MSTWKASKAGMATGLLRGAGSMFGGFLGSASNGADQLRDLVQGPGHDAALVRPSKRSARCSPSASAAASGSARRSA